MIIDYVDNLELSDSAAQRYCNELRTLDCPLAGLDFLNSQVRRIESEVGGRLDSDKVAHMFGNAPQLQGIPQNLVTCAFHWYSVTACNYVKLVGWLANEGDTSRATEYLKHVLPEVRIWRNKVGAHFAQVEPRREDTPAVLAKSVMSPLSFEDDAFYVGSLTLTMSSGEENQPRPEGIADWRWRLLMMSGRERSSSRQDMRWSLTHTHERLSARYRPNRGSKFSSGKNGRTGT